MKNSYDADASYVKITYIKNEDGLNIVEDDGHGMSQETVLNAWMVPSTDYKLKRKIVQKEEFIKEEKVLVGMQFLCLVIN